MGCHRFREVFLLFAVLALEEPDLAKPKRIASPFCSDGESVRPGWHRPSLRRRSPWQAGRVH